MVNKVDFMLHVTCMTYNHANYIGDTMNGFCMQQTNFPFACLIVDDASTDGEPEVIEKYIDDNFDMMETGLSTPEETDEYVRIYARHKENKNCYFCVLLLKYNHYSLGKPKTQSVADLFKSDKYIAMCEGDDYWTDPMKLQKQVDFLEANPDFSLCFHNVKVWKQKDVILVDDFITRDVPSETDIYELAKGNYIHTPSVVFRKDNRVFDALSKMGKLVVRDYPMWMLCAQYGKIKKFDECMAVYRYGSGIWSGGKQENMLLTLIQMYSRLIVIVENKKVRSRLEQRVEELNNQFITQYIKIMDNYNSLKKSHAYKLGVFLLSPIYKIKIFFKR